MLQFVFQNHFDLAKEQLHCVCLLFIYLFIFLYYLLLNISAVIHLDIFLHRREIYFSSYYFVYSERIKKLLTASVGIILKLSRVSCITQSFQCFPGYLFTNFQ